MGCLDFARLVALSIAITIFYKVKNINKVNIKIIYKNS